MTARLRTFQPNEAVLPLPFVGPKTNWTFTLARLLNVLGML